MSVFFNEIQSLNAKKTILLEQLKLIEKVVQELANTVASPVILENGVPNKPTHIIRRSRYNNQKHRILNYLRDVPAASISEIATAAQTPYSSAAAYVARMTKTGEVCRVGLGKYALPLECRDKVVSAAS